VTRYLVDASVLIHLDRIGELRFLREVLGPICVTQEVAREVANGPDALDLESPAFEGWVKVLPARKGTPRLGLGSGEASLLIEAGPGDRLVLDDAQARAVAEARGLEFVGLLGLIVAAVNSRKISPERGIELLDALVATEFRLSPALYANARKSIQDYRS